MLIVNIAVFIALIRIIKKIYLSLAIITLIFAFYLGFPSLNEAFINFLSNPRYIKVIILSFLIVFLGYLYNEVQLLNVLANNLSYFIKNLKVILSLIPALMGLLPFPGGALFTAPFVNIFGKGLSPEIKSYVNVWFRHVIFFIYPISTTILIASAQSGYDPFSIVSINIIYFILAVIIGYKVFSQLPHKELSNESAKGDVFVIFKILLPIFLAPIAGIFIGIITGIIISIAVFMYLFRPTQNNILNVLRKREIYEIPFIAFLSLLYGELIKLSNIALEIHYFITFLNLPDVLIITLFPSLLGFFSASPYFPLITFIPIAKKLGLINLVSTSVLYSLSLISYIISPLHICLILTVKYFKTDLWSVYKILLKVALPLLITIVFSAMLLNYFWET